MQHDTPPLRFWLGWFAFLVVVLLLIAAPLMAAGVQDIGAADVLAPLSAGGVIGAFIWAVKTIVKALQDANRKSDEHLARLVAVMERALDEMRASRDEFRAGRRAFQSAYDTPGRTRTFEPTIRPDPGEPNP